MSETQKQVNFQKLRTALAGRLSTSNSLSKVLDAEGGDGTFEADLVLELISELGGLVFMPADERDVQKGEQFIHRSDVKEALKDGAEFGGDWDWMSDVPMPRTARDVGEPIPVFVNVSPNLP